MREFLQAAFSTSELRSLLGECVGRIQAEHLPSEPAAHAIVAAQALEILLRNGAVESLFDTCSHARPLLRDRIQELRARWLVLDPTPRGASRGCYGLPRIEHEFQGRVAEMVALTSMLTRSPGCVVITGGAGIGKSTLTLKVLHAPVVQGRYGARRWFIRLDASANANAIVERLADALGCPAGEADWTLGAAPALLILDNFETPWERDARGTEALLRRLAGIETLTIVISIRGRTIPGGLSLARVIHLQPLRSAETRALFLSIAPEHAEDPTLDLLLARTAHVPLAIVLLARVAVGNELSNVARDWELRHTDVLASTGPELDRESSWAISLELSWSAPRMTDAARRLGTLLAALPDGIRVDDLAALLGHDGPAAATVLVHTGLAFFEAGRLRVLAPIREHLSMHHPAGAEDRRVAMEHYRRAVLLYTDEKRDGGFAMMTAHLLPEFANVDAVIKMGLASDDPGSWIELCLALANFVRFTGRSEPDPFPAALSAARVLGDRAVLARALRTVGHVALGHRRLGDAFVAYSEALTLTDANDLHAAYCKHQLGSIALFRGEFAESRALLDTALAVFRAEEYRLGVAQCVLALAELSLQCGDTEDAISRFDAAILLFRRIGPLPGEPYCFIHLGEIAARQARYDDAKRSLTTAVALYQELGIVASEARCERILGDMAAAMGRPADALHHFHRALELFRRVGCAKGERVCLTRIQSLSSTNLDGDPSASEG